MEKRKKTEQRNEKNISFMLKKKVMVLIGKRITVARVSKKEKREEIEKKEKKIIILF